MDIFLVIDGCYCGYSKLNEDFFFFLNTASEPNEPHWDKLCLFTNYVREGPAIKFF